MTFNVAFRVFFLAVRRPHIKVHFDSNRSKRPLACNDILGADIMAAVVAVSELVLAVGLALSACLPAWPTDDERALATQHMAAAAAAAAAGRECVVVLLLSPPLSLSLSQGWNSMLRIESNLVSYTIQTCSSREEEEEEMFGQVRWAGHIGGG
jgi:hypothetical protein